MSNVEKKTKQADETVRAFGYTVAQELTVEELKAVSGGWNYSWSGSVRSPDDGAIVQL